MKKFTLMVAVLFALFVSHASAGQPVAQLLSITWTGDKNIEESPAIKASYELLFSQAPSSTDTLNAMSVFKELCHEQLGIVGPIKIRTQEGGRICLDVFYFVSKENASRGVNRIEKLSLVSEGGNNVTYEVKFQQKLSASYVPFVSALTTKLARISLGATSDKKTKVVSEIGIPDADKIFCHVQILGGIFDFMK